MKKYQISLFVIISLILAHLVQIFYEDETLTFNKPIPFLVLFIFIFFGVVYKNEICFGIGIAGLLPCYLVGVNSILNANYYQFLLNFIFLILGCYLFLKMSVNKSWIIIIDGFIFEYYLFLPRIDVSQSVNEFIQGLFPSGFYFIVFISGFFMPIFLQIRQLYNNKLNSIPIENRIPPKTKLEKYFDDKLNQPYRRLGVFLLVLLGITCLTFIRSVIEGKLSLPYTISTWSFVISIIVLFVNINSPVLSSEVIAISPPILYLMVYDIEWQRGLTWILINFLFHAVIIVAAGYVIVKKHNAKWEYVFVWGYFLKTMCYVINLFETNYIVNVEFFMYMVFFETMITSVIYFLLSYKELNKISLKLKTETIEK